MLKLDVFTALKSSLYAIPASIEFVFDTGAGYTMLNKDFAELHGYEIFGNPMIFCGYESIPGELWNKYLNKSLSADEQGQFNKLAMICDLRKIPKLTFGLKQITDLVIATPQDEKRTVSNLLGRNFIDTFKHSIDPDNGKIYFKKRNIIINSDISYLQILNSRILN